MAPPQSREFSELESTQKSLNLKNRLFLKELTFDFCLLNTQSLENNHVTGNVKT